ncbi:MAG TPA: hypothetical protein VHI52_03095 [Verrucomicrobiae bacterium]|nr:hypothetical protein [Verrucomicrobiae bacterium]
MSRKPPKDHTKTTEFEVEGIEEAYEPAPAVARPKAGQPWKPAELAKLEVETPPEFQEPFEHTARIWILERRARGLLAVVKRWFVGKAKK